MYVAMNQKQFFDLLFHKGEQVCLSENVYGTALTDYTGAAGFNSNFVSINPLENSRRDSNVTSFRNILCEFDTGTIEEQLEIAKTIPYSTIVHSGGKSLHVIISLATPLESDAQYRKLVKRIYDKLPTVDRSGSNPSRFTRVPGIYRKDKEKYQELLLTGRKYFISEIEEWLGPAPVEEDTEFGPDAKISTGLSKWTKYFIAFGAPSGQWNSSLFKSACDMARNKIKQGEAMLIFEGVTGHLDSNDRKTIESAYKTVRSE